MLDITRVVQPGLTSAVDVNSQLQYAKAPFPSYEQIYFPLLRQTDCSGARTKLWLMWPRCPDSATRPIHVTKYFTKYS